MSTGWNKRAPTGLLLLWLLGLVSLQAQKPRQALGIGTFSRGVMLGYAYEVAPGHQLWVGPRLGFVTEYLTPQQLLPSVEAQYRFRVWHQQGKNMGQGRREAWLGPWLNLSRIPPQYNYNRSYWNTLGGLQGGISFPFFGSQRHQVELVAGIGYRYRHLDAPDWFIDQQTRFRNFFESFQPPYQGLLPRLGVNFFYGL